MFDGNGDPSLAAPGARSEDSGTWREADRVSVPEFESRMMPTTAKACGQYLNSRLATMEAARRGYDEAPLLNVDGNVAEAAVANVFLVNGRTLRTNDEKSSILMGITGTRSCSWPRRRVRGGSRHDCSEGPAGGG